MVGERVVFKNGMTTELYWHGQSDVEVFHDTERNIKYHPSERPHNVPEDAVDWYLEFAGWSEEPDNGEDDDSYPEDFEELSFINSGDWREVKNAILDGEVDPFLEDVEEAEEARDPSPRGSVLKAIRDRREALSE